MDPKTRAVVSYRGSKKVSELEAWSFVKKKPQFGIVTLCPPMTVGPVVHTVIRVQDFNESKAILWRVASGEELPVARVLFCIGVRDSAKAHVEVLLLPEAGNKRFTPASPERFSYSLAAKIILKEFPLGETTSERRG
jgi:nucleoside-diphosphate-sugar epimerase